MRLARKNTEKEQANVSPNKLGMALNMSMSRTDAFSKNVFLNTSILGIWGWNNRGEN